MQLQGSSLSGTDGGPKGLNGVRRAVKKETRWPPTMRRHYSVLKNSSISQRSVDGGDRGGPELQVVAQQHDPALVGLVPHDHPAQEVAALLLRHLAHEADDLVGENRAVFRHPALFDDFVARPLPSQSTVRWIDTASGRRGSSTCSSTRLISLFLKRNCADRGPPDSAGDRPSARTDPRTGPPADGRWRRTATSAWAPGRSRGAPACLRNRPSHGRSHVASPPENSMATNCVQQVNPFAPFSAPCRRTR